MTESSFQNLVRGKNVVFITVKNRDYIRVSQIERLLGKISKSYEIFTSDKRNPLRRMIDLNYRIKRIDFSDADVVVVGFLPQLVWKTVIRSMGNEKPCLVADFFLSLYDTVVLDRHIIRQRNPLVRLLRKMDKRVLDDAELVLTDTRADADFFAREYCTDQSKFEVMYLEADPRLTTEAKHSKIVGFPKKDVGAKDEVFKVLYFGTGLPLQGTDIVMEAFVKAALEYKNWTFKNVDFTFIGSSKHVPVRVKNSAMIQKNIKIIHWLPQEDLYREIESADLCLAGHFSPYIDKADRTIPGKAFIYEAMGKKMILADTQANHELFTEDERHIFVRRGSATAIAQVILNQLIDN